MHLINVRSLELETFNDGQVPPYAILSHRWGNTELRFEDVSKNMISKALSRALKAAHEKLKSACRVTTTLYADLQYLWIDTCCIDKRSSAELSEAINSMYRWYQDAEVCLAFLEDVEKEETQATTSQLSKLKSAKPDHTVPFEESVWFTRAWTLQELLAPRNVVFFDHSWQEIGTRDSLFEKIFLATGIPTKVLLQIEHPREHSIASKMSWAAKRVATRIEDRAYSLLGLFEVNMAMLYGEREQAFIRLQEEIIKRDRDKSFLLWGRDSFDPRLLATSPAEFLDFDKGKYIIRKEMSEVPFALNNAGLEIELRLFWWELNTYAARIAEAMDHNTPYAGRRMAYFVLLKPSSVPDFLHRVGLVIEEDSTERFIKPRTRKVTILRDSKRPSISSTLHSEETSWAFRVHEDSMPIKAYADKTRGMSKGDFQYADNGRKLLHFNLSPSSLESFNAFMHCKLAGKTQLFLVASFDFDFNPSIIFSNAPMPTVYWWLNDHDDPSLRPLSWEESQWAKVTTLPRKSETTPQRFACKTVNREGTLVTLPKYLSPYGWRIAVYMDFIKFSRKGRAVWMWQIAITQRRGSPGISLAESFASDPFLQYVPLPD